MKKINIGCNVWKIPGFINTDIDPSVNPDEVIDALNMPYEDNSIDEIYAGHFLEHLNWDEGQEFLKKCFDILVPGGKISIVVPDFSMMVKTYLAEKSLLKDLNDLSIYSYGQKDNVGGDSPTLHKYCYDYWLLERALLKTGFKHTEKMPLDHPYYVASTPLQVGCSGIKP